MKSWKVVLGVGGACAACCALPIATSVTALFAGSGLAIYSGALLPVVGVAAVAVLVGAGIWWRRRAAADQEACGCTPSGAGAATPGGCNAGSCG